MAATILDIINDQAVALDACGSRLINVSLAAPCTSAPMAILRTSWSVRGADPMSTPKGVAGSVYPGSTNHRAIIDGRALQALDAEMLAAAWALGAWDLGRTEWAPLPASADPSEPARGITAAIGSPYSITGVEDAPSIRGLDAARWIEDCARNGRLAWLCKPVRYGPELRRQAWIGKDRTLNADGGRDPKRWTAWTPVRLGRDHQTVIRLGRAPHGNRSKR